MMRVRQPLVAWLVAALVIAPLAAPATAAGATEPTRRLYLLGAEGGRLYWSADPTDPELDERAVTRRCGTVQVAHQMATAVRCYGAGAPGESGSREWFAQGTVLGEPASWSPARPLRYHIEIDATTMDPLKVGLIVDSTPTFVESEPLLPKSPGVFEGTVTTPGTIDPAVATFLGLEYRSTSESLVFDLLLRGRSWIELPDPVPAHGVPQLIAADTYAPTPSAYESATRELWFNDGDWQAWSFTGDTAEPRHFDVDLDRPAAILLAWAEGFDRSFFEEVERGEQPDTRRLWGSLELHLSAGGAPHVWSGGGYGGQGTAAAAVVDAPAGPVEVAVEGYGGVTSELPYTVHVVAIHGQRTLDAMSWITFAGTHWRWPVLAACVPPNDPVPSTAAVRSFTVDLDATTASIGRPAWTLAYDIPEVGYFPCAEEGARDWMRFTLPRTHVWRFGPTGTRDAIFTSYADSTFHMTVRYTYAAPGA